MFQDATSFNQDLSIWDIGSSTSFDSMFNGGIIQPNPVLDRVLTRTTCTTVTMFLFTTATADLDIKRQVTPSAAPSESPSEFSQVLRRLPRHLLVATEL
jgi:hypothetical protein